MSNFKKCESAKSLLCPRFRGDLCDGGNYFSSWQGLKEVSWGVPVDHP